MKFNSLTGVPLGISYPDIRSPWLPKELCTGREKERLEPQAQFLFFLVEYFGAAGRRNSAITTQDKQKKRSLFSKWLSCSWSLSSSYPSFKSSLRAVCRILIRNILVRFVICFIKCGARDPNKIRGSQWGHSRQRRFSPNGEPYWRLSSDCLR